jgi:hypothetical protein
VAKHVGSNLWTPGQNTVAQVKTAAYTKTLPGAPAGEYVVIQYDSNFEHQQAAMETLVPTLDGDGQWRGSGYFIQQGIPGARHDEIPPASIPHGSLAICVTVYKPFTSIDGPARISLFS